MNKYHYSQETEFSTKRVIQDEKLVMFEATGHLMIIQADKAKGTIVVQTIEGTIDLSGVLK
jgi:hypothetical protein